MGRVDLYDTTLRDGSQTAGISLSVEDKLQVLSRLDQFGVAYVEGGWPGSNPKDAELFARARHMPLERTTLTAFGMTRRPKVQPGDDRQLAALVEAGTSVACIFGKSWTMHVEEALRTTLDENLAMVSDSVAWLRSQGMRVFFDAEHFFDGFATDKAYALAVIEAAATSGAEIVVLCDTNGGTLPHLVSDVVEEVMSRIGTPVGAHFHEDSGCGVANSLAAVRTGAVQVQGCVNGYGERCGNADLLAVAANLELKMGMRCLPDGKLRELADVSHYVAEVCNRPPESHRAYVGTYAFAHKGGIHVSAVVRNTRTYEHVDPALVGNDRHLVTSDLSGLATLRARAATLGLTPDETAITAALARLKQLEYEGYAFEAADGSLEVLLREAMGWRQTYFEPLSFRAIVEKSAADIPTAEATVRLVVRGERLVAAAEGHGPVDALNRAVRVALRPVYPEIAQFHLSDYKVRVLDPESATAAKVRVLIETTDAHGSWMTVGVSENIIEASWKALLDSVVIGLLRHDVEAEG
ncbi:MAG: citramalate synthase [Actinomycetota bacterium]